MIQFEIKNGKAVWKEEYSVYGELRAIWDLSKDKDLPERLLTVIYQVSDEESALRNMQEYQKWEYALANCQISQKEYALSKELLESAASFYTMVNNTSLHRAKKALSQQVDAVVEMMSTTVPEIKKKTRTKNVGTKEEPEWQEEVSYESNADEVEKFAKLITSLSERADQIEKMYQKDKASGKLRADKEPGDMAKGKLINPVKQGNYKR